MIRESYWKSYLESICYCRPQLLPHSLKVWDHGLSLHSSSFACLAAKLLQLHATLWDPMDCSLPGSSAHGILQARTLEWVAVPSTRGASWPSGQSHVSCVAGGFFTEEPAGKPEVLDDSKSVLRTQTTHQSCNKGVTLLFARASFCFGWQLLWACSGCCHLQNFSGFGILNSDPILAEHTFQSFPETRWMICLPCASCGVMETLTHVRRLRPL